VLAGLLDLLYPPRCSVCRLRSGETLCSRCRLEFTPVPPPFCLRCACPLSVGAARMCQQCRTGETLFAAARSLTLFDGRMRTAIHRLKFGGRRELGPILGELLAVFVRQTDSLGHPELVVAVPLHPARLRERGYNHALLLAQPVARMLGVPLMAEGLVRVGATIPQTVLRREQRWANVFNAFRVPAASGDVVRGRSVLLVDDVLTSGATAAECARTLLLGGATAVYVVTLARAMPPGAVGPTAASDGGGGADSRRAIREARPR